MQWNMKHLKSINWLKKKKKLKNIRVANPHKFIRVRFAHFWGVLHRDCNLLYRECNDNG